MKNDVVSDGYGAGDSAVFINHGGEYEVQTAKRECQIQAIAPQYKPRFQPPLYELPAVKLKAWLLYPFRALLARR